MGSQQSKKPDVPPPMQVSEAAMKQLFEAQRQEYERKHQRERDSIIAAQEKLKKVAETAAALRSQNEVGKVALLKLQEEAAGLAAQRKEQEEAILAAKKNLQEEVTYFKARRKLQDDFINALQEEAERITAQRKLEKATTTRKLEEEAAKRKLEEEAAKRKHEEEVAKRKLEEEAVKRKIEEEAAKRKLVEEALKRKLEEEAFKRKLKEEAAKRKLEEKAAKRKLEEEAAKRKLEEEAAKRKLEEEAAKRKLEEEAAKRKLEEETAKRKIEEEAAKRKLVEEALKKKLEEEAFKKKLEKDAAQRKLEEAISKKVQEKYVTRTLNKRRTTHVSRSRYCNTCYKLSTTMFKCDKGHGSCNNCRRSWRSCGICSSKISCRRCFDIKNDPSPQTKVPCPNTDDGCKLFIKRADMEAHMKECPFKEHDCPLGAVFGNCTWQGKLNGLSSHFDEMHPNCLVTEVGSELCIKNIHRTQRYVCLIKNGYHFVFHLKISEIDSKVYMVVQLIGTKHSAMNCLHEIHVYNKSQSRRKYLYTDNCCSTIDDIDQRLQ